MKAGITGSRWKYEPNKDGELNEKTCANVGMLTLAGGRFSRLKQTGGAASGHIWTEPIGAGGGGGAGWGGEELEMRRLAPAFSFLMPGSRFTSPPPLTRLGVDLGADIRTDQRQMTGSAPPVRWGGGNCHNNAPHPPTNHEAEAKQLIRPAAGT